MLNKKNSNPHNVNFFLEEVDRQIHQGNIPKKINYMLQDKSDPAIFYHMSIDVVDDIHLITCFVAILTQFPRVDISSIEVAYEFD